MTKSDLVAAAMALRLPARSKARHEPSAMSSLRVTNDLVRTNLAPSPTSVEQYRKNKGSKLSFGSLTTSARTKANKAQTEPLQKSPSQVREELGPTCKARPRHNKGSGGSRSFIPWCNR